MRTTIRARVVALSSSPRNVRRALPIQEALLDGPRARLAPIRAAPLRRVLHHTNTVRIIVVKVVDSVLHITVTISAG
jgi:hypothetical protein